MTETQLKKTAVILVGFVLLVIGTVLLKRGTETISVGTGEGNFQVHNMEGESDLLSGIISAVSRNKDGQNNDAGVTGQTDGLTDEAYMVMSQGTALVDSGRWKKLKEKFRGGSQIILPGTPEGAVITYDTDYMARTINIKIDKSVYELPDVNCVQRISDGRYYIGEHDALLPGDPVRKIFFSRHESDTYAGTYCTDIMLTLDSIYEYDIHTFDDVMCIDMLNPHQVYENVIVVDAGHGGPDDGCHSVNGRYYEKDITLDIVKQLKKKLDKMDIKVYYTRLDDSGRSLHERVSAANAVKADMFVSIHCNSYEYYWLPGVNGAEALYSSVCKKQKKKSKKAAEIILDSVTDATGIRKREVINRKNELHILRKSKVPATIIEVGYISDSNDLKRLVGRKNIKKTAEGIYNGIIKAYKNIYEKEIQ